MNSYLLENSSLPPIRSVAFVDSALGQTDTLQQALSDKHVIQLSPNTDGVEEITQVLSEYQNLESIHIFSHGSSGELQLGNATLSQAFVAEYRDDLQSWGDALLGEGDVFLYGCDVAAGETGEAFVQQVSQLTQADVAASNNTTGHVSLGGDWTLELSTGETGDSVIASDYEGMLATYNGKIYQLTGGGSKTWEDAQAEAESLGGNLVTINTAAEETFLKQTFGDSERLWIGINDRQTEGQFEWVSGEAIAYTNWAPNEPNNSRGNQDYGLMNFGGNRQWDDEFSGTQLRGIIEISSTEPPVTPPVDPPVTPPVTPPTRGTGRGLTAEYYNNIDFTDLAFTRVDKRPSFNWRRGAPAASMDADTFSVRWTGQVQPKFSETYTFHTRADDTVKLWVNNQLIIDVSAEQDGVRNTGTIDLVAGQKYDIRMDYQEDEGRAIARLFWSSTSQKRSIIQRSQLYASADTTSTFSLEDSTTILASESSEVATFTAVRTGGTQARATLEYTLNEVGSSSAASPGLDYIQPVTNGAANTGQIVFEVGETEKTVAIPIINDDLIEGNETFAVGIQNPSTGNLGTPRTVLVTILDDDIASIFSVTESTLTLSEGGAAASITVQRSGDTSGTASVDFRTGNGSAIAGEDYTEISGTLTFSENQIFQTITVPILDDRRVESSETLTVTLSDPSGAVLGTQTTSTITILDNDLELGDLNRQTAVSGLVKPIAIDWTPDGRYMLVAQKNGVVKVVDNGVLRFEPLVNLTSQVNDTRDRGLIGLAVHPDFANTPYVYLSYTYDPPETAGRSGLAGPDGNGNRPSRLVRLTVDPATMIADPASLVVLAGTNSTWEYTSRPDDNSTGNNSITPSGIVNGTTITAPASQIDVGTQDNDPDRPGIQNQNIRDYLATDSESHSIGAVHFGPDGLLYLSNGDGTSYNFVDPRTVRVQDIDNLSGKMLRLDPITGKGVSDNPFYNGDPDSNRSKVFYSGLRNPFRFTFDPTTALPVIGDVGWGRWEEVNTGIKGSNFGWPYFEGPERTGGYQSLSQAIAFYNNGNITPGSPSNQAAVFPTLSRIHGAPDNARAIMVGDFYNEDTLMFGDVNNGTLYAATLDASRQVTDVKLFDSDISYVVDMEVGPDGRLYGVSLISGQVLRWDPV
ncbi:MAG: DUF4347 domain-containing protein [Cyanobacteria bacterium P01_D01_bin.1]